jgi:hypothetical protein
MAKKTVRGSKNTHTVTAATMGLSRITPGKAMGKNISIMEIGTRAIILRVTSKAKAS